MIAFSPAFAESLGILIVIVELSLFEAILAQIKAV